MRFFRSVQFGPRPLLSLFLFQFHLLETKKNCAPSCLMHRNGPPKGSWTRIFCLLPGRVTHNLTTWIQDMRLAYLCLIFCICQYQWLKYIQIYPTSSNINDHNDHSQSDRISHLATREAHAWRKSFARLPKTGPA